MPQLNPILTLWDLCGPGYVFNSRASPRASAWLPSSDALADARTGNQVVVLGQTPVICSAAVRNKSALDFLSAIGFSIAPCYSYHNEKERLEIINNLARQGIKFVVQHVHPFDEIPPEHCWVAPQTLSYLNNKANLVSLVSPEYTLPCKTIQADEVGNHEELGFGFPFVVKVATDETSGGGSAVFVCDSRQSVMSLNSKLKPEQPLVIEQYVEMVSNKCVNFAIDRQGKIIFVGASEQIIKDQTYYEGNWLDKEAHIPAKAIEVGRKVVTAGVEMGYRGFVGLDMAFLADGSFFIYDLNFRFNGSTTPLLLFDSLVSHFGATVGRIGSWKFKGGFDQFLKAAVTAYQSYSLVPYGFFDPSSVGMKGATPALTGILLGSDCEDIQEKAEKIKMLGLFY